MCLSDQQPLKPSICKLEDWSVSSDADRYTAPEHAVLFLCGVVYGHSKQPDGKVIATSQIVKVEGRIIHTLNSIYELGTVNPAYYDFCVKMGHHVPTQEEPIRVHRS